MRIMLPEEIAKAVAQDAEAKGISPTQLVIGAITTYKRTDAGEILKIDGDTNK